MDEDTYQTSRTSIPAELFDYYLSFKLCAGASRGHRRLEAFGRMETIFGRKKGRTRQSSVSGQDLNDRSVPYDKLGPSPRSPVPVNTVSQGLRGTSHISAPITNPTLTQDGTEFNLFSIGRQKLERDRIYNQERDERIRPQSPSSISTADSSTLSSDSSPYTATFRHARTYTPSLRQVLNDGPTSSHSRPPEFTQFLPYPPGQHPFTVKSHPSSNTIRPRSSVLSNTESHRSSKYASSLSDSTGHFPFYHPHRHGAHDDFNFPRPENDDDIEGLFEIVKRTRDLADMPNLTIDQKWQIVHNDEHIRWREEKNREEQAKKHNESGQPASVVENTPEWYIKKFLDKAITAKQVSSLLVSLRSKELRFAYNRPPYVAHGFHSWFKHFVTIQGTSVLAQTLMHISRKPLQRSVSHG